VSGTGATPERITHRAAAMTRPDQFALGRLPPHPVDLQVIERHVAD
jgi:hypothetical protein